MADDGVGLVLDTLRQRDRWNQTIVLVTSDHGEAFLEHGRVGHNTHVTMNCFGCRSFYVFPREQ